MTKPEDLERRVQALKEGWARPLDLAQAKHEWTKAGVHLIPDQPGVGEGRP